MIYGIVLILLVVVLTNLLLVVFWYSKFKPYLPEQSKIPFVSVLIAARNEEKNIERCLQSLVSQNYPSSQIEILVGDDMSEDNTAMLAMQFPQVRLVRVTENMGKARGKANVLAHLAKEAKGGVFLITDADVRLNPDWARSMIKYLNPSVGIVNGATGIENNIFQHYEWLYFQGMMKVFTDIYRPATAVGNNMLITREAYESIGGYEALNFSITEDFALFKAVENKGFTLRHVIEPGVLAHTFSPGGLKKLLHQRKRWMTGAFKLPVPVIVLFAFIGVYFPMVLLGLYFIPQLTLSIFVIKLFLQAIFIKAVADKLGIRLKGGLVLFEFYSGIIAAASMLYYLIPGKIIWKERKY